MSQSSNRSGDLSPSLTLRPSLSFLVGDGASNSSHPPWPSLSFLNSDERLPPQWRRVGVVGIIEGKEGGDFRLEQRRW
ncbi:unnamed protein product [Linum trigynum]|uniref:Uncharacterized protein n=1 Tax=Linum trigynum TaxID=586398 RepID=A0AAV2E8J1_9ROSI